MWGNANCLKSSEWEPQLWESKFKELRTIGPDLRVNPLKREYFIYIKIPKHDT